MKSKLSTLLRAIISVIGIITIVLSINVAICYYVPSLEPYLVIMYIPIFVWMMYNILRDKQRYFLVSYHTPNGMGQICMSLTHFIPDEIIDYIKKQINEEVIIINAIELTRKEYDLNHKYYESKLQDK